MSDTITVKCNCTTRVYTKAIAAEALRSPEYRCILGCGMDLKPLLSLCFQYERTVADPFGESLYATYCSVCKTCFYGQNHPERARLCERAHEAMIADQPDMAPIINKALQRANAKMVACICFGPPVPDCPKHAANCRTGDLMVDD